MPRSIAKDICEMFGYRPDDTSPKALEAWRDQKCPFVNSPCTKYNHDQSIVYGVCSVVNKTKRSASSNEVIICPKRLYTNNYVTIKNVAKKSYGSLPFVAGGDLKALRKEALKHDECVVAFGQNSGNEISANSGGQLSMDWVLVKYSNTNNDLKAESFVGIEVQSIDITGNYRDNWQAYNNLRDGQDIDEIPVSKHGMNWANVHKRLIPQIIRKGNIYKNCTNCKGFYFVLPDFVYLKFEEVIGNIPNKPEVSNENLCIMTYSLGPEVSTGSMREIILERELCYSLKDIAESFASLVDKKAVAAFENKIINSLL